MEILDNREFLFENALDSMRGRILAEHNVIILRRRRFDFSLAFKDSLCWEDNRCKSMKRGMMMIVMKSVIMSLMVMLMIMSMMSVMMMMIWQSILV